MPDTPLTVPLPRPPLLPLCRCAARALAGRDTEVLSRPEGPLHGRRLLFALSLDEGGCCRGSQELLSFLRTVPGCLRGCVGGVLIDGPGDLFTKAVGRELVLAANLAGCAFVGRPLVEGTGSLRNFTVQAKKRRLLPGSRLSPGGLRADGPDPRLRPPPAGAAEAAGAPRLQPPPPPTPWPCGGWCGNSWRTAAPSRRSACAAAPWWTAPAAPTPPASTTGSRAAASMAGG